MIATLEEVKAAAVANTEVTTKVLAEIEKLKGSTNPVDGEKLGEIKTIIEDNNAKLLAAITPAPPA